MVSRLLTAVVMLSGLCLGGLGLKFNGIASPFLEFFHVATAVTAMVFAV